MTDVCSVQSNARPRFSSTNQLAAPALTRKCSVRMRWGKRVEARMKNQNTEHMCVFNTVRAKWAQVRDDVSVCLRDEQLQTVRDRIKLRIKAVLHTRRGADVRARLQSASRGQQQQQQRWSGELLTLYVLFAWVIKCGKLFTVRYKVQQRFRNVRRTFLLIWFPLNSLF